MSVVWKKKKEKQNFLFGVPRAVFDPMRERLILEVSENTLRAMRRKGKWVPTKKWCRINHLGAGTSDKPNMRFVIIRQMANFFTPLELF